MSELNALGKNSSCTTQVSDKVRLISYSEYWNMSPYYESEDNNYPNVGQYIKRLSKTSDYASWLYCSSTNCGSSTYMGFLSIYGVVAAPFGVRPVITVVK